MTETVTTTDQAHQLAAQHDLPAFNLQGDPLTSCTGCGVVIYAVASLGAQRRRCSGCRGVA